MNWNDLIPPILEFLASLFSTSLLCISSCGWPLSIIILGFLLRKPLIGILPSLSKLKAGNFEFEFSRKIEELEQEAERAQLPEIDEGELSPLQTQATNLYNLADINPRSAILESWLLVETSLSETALRLGFYDDEKISKSPYYILNKLTSANLISNEIKSIVFKLRDLRNKAVHEIDFDISINQVYDYIRLALRVTRLIRNETDNI